MKIEVFAKGVEGEKDGWMRFGFAERGAQIKGEALMGYGAKMLEERTMSLEIGAEHLRQREDVVLVGDCGKDAGYEEFGAGLDVFLVAGRAEPAGFAGEGEECVEAAVVTADAGETAFEGAAVEEFVDDLWDGGTQWPVTGLIVVRVTSEEAGKVAVGALPEGRFAGIACPVDVHAPETESNSNMPSLWDTRHQSTLQAGAFDPAPRISARESSKLVWRAPTGTLPLGKSMNHTNFRRCCSRPARCVRKIRSFRTVTARPMRRLPGTLLFACPLRMFRGTRNPTLEPLSASGIAP